MTREQTAASGDAGQRRRVRVRFYDADADDRPIPLKELGQCEPGEHQLLWVDLVEPTPEDLKVVTQALGLPGALLSGTRRQTPQVRVDGPSFRIDVVPIASSAELAFKGSSLSIVAGNNRVVTLHDGTVDFIDVVAETSSADSDWGVLSSDSFAATLLNWHLSSYQAALADLERQVDRLEVRILEAKAEDCLGELRRMRLASSRLRRMLASHRTVFAALGRPEFRASGDPASIRHFQQLEARFERTVDLVEHARDLVVGSFELFSSQTALLTNRAMGRLTFVTVVLGVLAVFSGTMGMNFEAAIFAAKDAGFWTTIGLMLLIAMISLLLGRWRKWF